MHTFKNGETQSGDQEDGVLNISTPQDSAKVVKAIQVQSDKNTGFVWFG